MTDIEKCIVAIHDYGTREGATRHKVMEQLKKDGFSLDVIRKALEEMT